MLVIRFSKDEKLIILLGLIVGLVLLGGCGEEATKPDNISKPEKTGSLKLSISLPKEKLITKTEEVTVTKMQVKVINQQMQKIIRTESKSVTDDQVKFTVNKLTPDVKYKVKAVAKDSKGNPVYQGSSLRKLEDKAVAEVNISLQLTTAEQVVFQMKNLPEQAAAGIVRLVRPESGKVDQEVRLDLANQKAALENILATTYNVEIDLFKSKDQTESITGFPLEITKLLIYPGRNTVTAPIDLAGEYNDADGDGKGEIKVDVSWPQRPDVPTKVQANTVEEGVHLTWESQAEGYIVLRSKNQAPQTAKPLMETIITNNNYQDLEVTAGTTYYYWIQAYSKNKLASQLSEPQKVTITEISKYTFAAIEKKEVDLGVINQG